MTAVAPKMIGQPFFSILPCFHPFEGLRQTFNLSFPLCCLPIYFSACISFSLLAPCPVGSSTISQNTTKIRALRIWPNTLVSANYVPYLTPLLFILLFSDASCLPPPHIIILPFISSHPLFRLDHIPTSFLFRYQP